LAEFLEVHHILLLVMVIVDLVGYCKTHVAAVQMLTLLATEVLVAIGVGQELNQQLQHSI
jgi:hypothetical protein